MKIEEILATLPGEEILKADGFNDAIIGFDSKTFRLIYSISKCIDVLVNGSDGLSYDDAIEYFNYNILDAYVGPQTPIWCYDLNEGL